MRERHLPVLDNLIIPLIVEGMNEPPATTSVRRYFPVALSGLVYPGVGQMAQGRWVAGAFYLLAFTGLFIWFAINVYQVLTAYFNLGNNFETAEPLPLPLSQILIPFALSLLVFFVNLIDAWFACRRTIAKPAMPAMPDMPGTPVTPALPATPDMPAKPATPAEPRTPPKP